MSRMRVLTVLLLIGCCCCPAQSVLGAGGGGTPEEVFAGADKDGDGAMTEQEFLGWVKDAKSPPMTPKRDLVLWSLITFGLFLFVLKKMAWQPLIEGLTSREAGLRQAAADTEHALEKSQALLAEHEKKLASAADEVREIIAEAKRDAEHTKQDILSTAQSEAEATRNRAIEDIEHAKDVALKELFDSMAGRVASASEHVIGRSLNSDDQQRFIEEALSSFGEAQG